MHLILFIQSVRNKDKGFVMLMTPALFEELKKRWKNELGPLYIAGRSVIIKKVLCNWVFNEADTFK
jgi:hypothetical protein